MEDLEKSLVRSWPPIIARSEVGRLTGGVLSAKTLSNLGDDGPRRLRIGKKIVFRREDLARWLASRAQEVHEDEQP